jgi:hypothetical protein
VGRKEGSKRMFMELFLLVGGAGILIRLNESTTPHGGAGKASIWCLKESNE